jgi:uncharacterized membrane protein
MAITGLFNQKHRHFLSEKERDEVMHAVKTQEQSTTGEIRIFIESKCKLVNTLDRAEEVFGNLAMQKTEERDAVLIYIAYQHREFAVYGDSGCIIKFPKTFWKNEAKRLGYHFFKHEYKDGLLSCIEAIGHQLHTFFPLSSASIKKNELPDEIVFGK